MGFGGGDPNLYAYVGNSPQNLVDPSGTIPVPLVLPLAACLGGAAGAVVGNMLIGRKADLLSIMDGCLSGIPLWRLGPLLAPLLPRIPGLGPRPVPGLGPGSGPAAGPSVDMGGRGLDAIIRNPELFERFINHRFPSNQPFSVGDSSRIWQTLVEMGRNPVWHPGHPGTMWPGPHINVPGTPIHIPVSPDFVPW